MQPANDLMPTVPVASDNQVRPLDETKKLSFWVSQIFILLATVLGVYLASSQGFRQALAYGEIQAEKSNYYLRKSLQNELADNIPLVREYMERLNTGGLPARQAPFSLDTFVWDSLKNSSATLETPPELLREARKFYRGVADLQQKIASNTYSVRVGNERLKALVDHMENEVLPAYEKNIEDLRLRLMKKDVHVE